MSESNFDIAALMAKPVWQMSGEEFVQLADYALSSKPTGTPSEPLYVYGIQALAAYIGCCPSTLGFKAGVWYQDIGVSVGYNPVIGKNSGQVPMYNSLQIGVSVRY